MTGKFICVLFVIVIGFAQAWPKRVLLTNDDGIDEKRLQNLAFAFAKVTETYMVASTVDRSGSGNYMAIGKYQKSLFVMKEHQEKNLVVYAVAGYPADCVAFAVGGLLKDNPPDLVISGINGGANLGMDGWFGSGTIGAARTAAYLGLPALAVSGLDDDDPEMVAKVNQWVIKLAQSEAVRNMKTGEFWNINLPRISAVQIKGIKIAPPSRSLYRFSFKQVWEETETDGDSEEVWLETGKRIFEPQNGSDIDLYRQNYIIITPMQLGEFNGQNLERLQKQLGDLPEIK